MQTESLVLSFAHLHEQKIPLEMVASRLLYLKTSPFFNIDTTATGKRSQKLSSPISPSLAP